MAKSGEYWDLRLRLFELQTAVVTTQKDLTPEENKYLQEERRSIIKELHEYLTSKEKN